MVTVAALGVGFGVALGFVGEVVVADGEAVLGVVGGTAEVVAPDEADGGDFALGGEGEDVGGVEEKVLAEVACGAGLLAEVVVADEKEGGLGVVGDVADDAAELCGHVYTAEGHEVVDVVDDDEFGLELADEGFDVAVDGVDVLALGAEDVEADEMEVFLGGGVGDELVVDLSADVGAVESVDPEDLAGGDIANGGRGGCHGTGNQAGGNGLSCQDFDGEELGEVVGATGFLAGEVGAVMLADDGLAVKCD